MDLTHLSMCVLLLVFVGLQIQIRQTYNSGYICTETGGAPVRTVSLTSTAKKSRVIRSHLQPSSEAITISTANITMAMLRFMHSTHFLPIQAFGQANLVIQMICILWSSYKFTMDLRWPDFICTIVCMYGTEPFVHELSVKLACMWYYILRAHKLANYSAHNSFM